MFCIGSYDKWFCIKSWQEFTDLLLCKAPSKKETKKKKQKKTKKKKQHFNIVKLGFTVYRGIHYFCYICSIGGSIEYPQSMFWAETWKISEFSSENFQFVVSCGGRWGLGGCVSWLWPFIGVFIYSFVVYTYRVLYHILRPWTGSSLQWLNINSCNPVW